MFQSVLKVFYVKLYVRSLVDKLKWFYENARRYNKIYSYVSLSSLSAAQQSRDVTMIRAS